MSINDTISRAAATSPIVGVAVSNSSVQNAILAGMQTGDTMEAGLLGAASAQALEANKLLASLSGLGRHVDLHA